MSSSNDSDTETASEEEPPRMNYPPSPEVKTVETESSGFDTPRSIEVEIEYYPSKGYADKVTETVSFRVEGATAVLSDVRGSRRLSEQLVAIVTACEGVKEHPIIKNVEGLSEAIGEAEDFIKKCEKRSE
ncbi:hypothetical protein RYH80_18535 [Halobaculum sp. MBLA0147]|uniref:hypothetical protein n=1 Tax=Halobaculum sp. MBLA0147 TaxID=3079934 RepID=UPI00352388A1